MFSELRVSFMKDRSFMEIEIHPDCVPAQTVVWNKVTAAALGRV